MGSSLWTQNGSTAAFAVFMCILGVGRDRLQRTEINGPSELFNDVLVSFQDKMSSNWLASGRMCSGML